MYESSRNDNARTEVFGEEVNPAAQIDGSMTLRKDREHGTYSRSSQPRTF